jgi:RIO kinase 1
MTIYSFLNRGILDHIYGVVGAGKESRIYLGVDSKGENLAVKIYLIVSAEFKRGMLTYIIGDPRFNYVKRDTRSLVYSWAQKEFKNLKRAYASGIRVPRPIHVEKNVLIMEFIGDNGVPALLLKEKPPRNPSRTYKTLLSYVRTLYLKANLVHGDLSEYNVMNYDEEPVIFDFSQATPREHPMVKEFLLRDLNNLNHFFKELGVRTRKVENLYKWVTEDE